MLNFSALRVVRAGIVVLAAICGLTLFKTPSRADGETKIENFPDGSGAQFKYDVLPDGSKQGPYNELYPSGKPKVRGSYVKNLKSGIWITFDEKGIELASESYKKDLLDGPTVYNFPTGKPQTKLTYKAGEIAGPMIVSDIKGRILYKLSYPRARQTVMKAIATLTTPGRPAPVFTQEPLLTAPYKAGKLNDATCQAALKYVKLYRFLSGVDITNIVVDPVLSAKAQAASVLIHRLGHLTHTPDNPGDMPADFFKEGDDGCHHSNLFQGGNTLFDTIDGYMDDSDESNVQKIGHRQWLLHPAMQKIGFGFADHFSATHVLDAATHPSPDFNFVAYPGEGYYPASLVHNDCAWSIHLSPHWTIDASAKVVMHQLDDHFAPLEAEVLTHVIGMATMTIADWHVFVFRPELPKTAGARYVVELTGAQMKGRPQPLTYMVDLFDPSTVPPASQPASVKN